MTKPRNPMDKFREEYFEYLDGLRDEPPPLDRLSAGNRAAAEDWIASLATAQGLDPYDSPPSVAELLVYSKDDTTPRPAPTGLAKRLLAGLRPLDAGLRVLEDAASVASQLASRLVLHVRGLRLRVVTAPPDTSVDAFYAANVESVAAVFGAFPDTSGVLIIAEDSRDLSVIVEREDVVMAIETPSGRIAPPRISRPVGDPVSVCSSFVLESVPSFEPFSYVAASVGISAGMVEPQSLADDAINKIVASGGRARIKAKNEAWTSLDDRDKGSIAEILRDALEGELSDTDYEKRIEQAVEAA